MQPDDDQIYKLLEHVDHEPPRLSATDIARAARVGKAAWRRAAIFIVAAAGVATAAVAMPGSPLRAWLNESPQPDAPSVRARPDDDPAGIIVSADERLTIDFNGLVTPANVHFRLIDGNQVMVRSSSRDVAFTSDDGRITVDSKTGDAEFEVHMPRGAAYIEIRVAGKRVLVKNGNLITGSLLPALSQTINDAGSIQ